MDFRNPVGAIVGLILILVLVIILLKLVAVIP